MGIAAAGLAVGAIAADIVSDFADDGKFNQTGIFSGPLFGNPDLEAPGNDLGAEGEDVSDWGGPEGVKSGLDPDVAPAPDVTESGKRAAAEGRDASYHPSQPEKDHLDPASLGGTETYDRDAGGNRRAGGRMSEINGYYDRIEAEYEKLGLKAPASLDEARERDIRDMNADINAESHGNMGDFYGGQDSD